MHLDHLTIRTRNLSATHASFPEIIDDPEERARPQAIQRIPGHRLFKDDEPLVHLIGSRGQPSDFAQGNLFAIDNPLVTGAVIDGDALIS